MMHITLVFAGWCGSFGLILILPPSCLISSKCMFLFQTVEDHITVLKGQVGYLYL